ncbi:MAG: hypothetical protein WBV06_16945 [Acidimicrobiia bacterium]
MLTTSVLPWLRDRRLVALLAAVALVASLALAIIGNSWTTNAAPADPTTPTVEEEVVAGPSWTMSARVAGQALTPVSTTSVLVGSWS